MNWPLVWTQVKSFMEDDPFCAVASGPVEIHLNVVGSGALCAKQTDDEHKKSHRSEATVKTPFPHVFANEQRNVNEVNLIGFMVSIRFNRVVKPVRINLHIAVARAANAGNSMAQNRSDRNSLA